jgi:hypothetical protein
MAMQERLKRKKRQTQPIPKGHYPAQGTGEKRQSLRLRTVLQTPDSRIDKGRKGKFIACHQSRGSDCDCIEKVHFQLLDN